MRPLVMTALILLVPLAANRTNDGEVRLQFLPPEQREANTAPAKGPAGQDAVNVTGGSTTSRTTIAVLENPPISTDRYVVRGRVKYEQVAGDGYLELFNEFGPQRTYFTRSLAPWGKMRKLTGNSNWRDFELPFYAEAGMRPQRLTLNVVLPGAG